MMLGALLASLGMVASSFSSTLGQLYFTAGFITGDRHSIVTKQTMRTCTGQTNHFFHLNLFYK